MERDLEAEIARLREKLMSINQREVAALSILSMPIDDLTANQMLTEQAEERLAKAKGRLKNETGEGTLSSLMETVRGMETENDMRRRDIEKLTNTLRLSKSRYTESTTITTPRKSTPTSRKQYNNNSSYVEECSDAVEYINSVYSSLREKKMHLDTLQAETDAYQEEISETRRKCEAGLNEKLTRIERLSKTVRDTDYIIMAIEQAEEHISKFAECYSDLRAERSRLERRVSSMARETKHSQSLKTLVGDALKSTSEKQNLLAEQLDVIEEKRVRVQTLTDEVDELKHELKRYSQRVTELEEEVQRLEIEHSDMISQLQMEASDLSSSMMACSSVIA